MLRGRSVRSFVCRLLPVVRTREIPPPPISLLSGLSLPLGIPPPPGRLRQYVDPSAHGLALVLGESFIRTLTFSLSHTCLIVGCRVQAGSLTLFRSPARCLAVSRRILLAATG